MIDSPIDSKCFSLAKLRAYARSELTEADAELLENHLASCVICRRALVESCGDETGPAWLGWTLEPETPRNASAEQIGKYRLCREIGRGGMGIIYEACDEETDRRVAIKSVNFASGGRGSCMRAIQEFHTLSRLSHPGIVPVLDVVSHEERPHLVLEFIDGLPLNRWQNLRPIDANLAARIVHALAVAVDYAHQQNVIHRDLKPSNVMVLAPDPEHALVPDAPCDVKVTDFGLAKIVDGESELTQTGEVMGTPAYMSPEQTLGIPDQIGPPADVYGLGAILYELLTGRPPLVAADPIRTLELVRNTEPIPPLRLRPDLPKSLNTICLKCLEKLPVDRYPTASALADDLAAFLARQPIKARPPGLIKQGTRWASRNRGLALGLSVAAASLLALLAGSLWFAKSQRELRLAAEQKEKRAQLAESVADQQKRIAIENEEETRQFWRHSLGEMEQFYQVLGREIGLGVRSPEELRNRANRLVISLYGDYVRQLGPPEQWALSDVEAVARYAFMAREANGMQQPSERFGDAVLALDRIEENSADKLQPLRVRASLLERQARQAKDDGDFETAERLTRQAIDTASRIIGLTPMDPNAYRNASIFAISLADIRRSLGDRDGFLRTGQMAVDFQRDGAMRLGDDAFGRFWLSERLGHYAFMHLQVGATDGIEPLIAEARQLLADGPLPESLHPQRELLLGSFDRMESELRSAANPAPSVPTPDP